MGANSLPSLAFLFEREHNCGKQCLWLSISPQTLVEGAAPKPIRGCGHFIELNVNSHFTSEFCRAQSAERQLNSLVPIPNHVRFNLLHEIL